MLGSPRQVRRFARDYESYVQQGPFTVRIASTSSGKRYVRQSEGGAPHRPRQVLCTATILARMVGCTTHRRGHPCDGEDGPYC
jgi:hypothetical protein